MFCRHILLCNLLTTILRPNFEEPLDTAKQLVEKNITLYDEPATVIWKKFLLESSIPEYNKLGETFLTPDNWRHFRNITDYYVNGTGTHAFMGASLSPSYLARARWHRSKEKVAGLYPYGGYLTNKKWHLNEVISYKEFVHALLLIQS